MTGSGDWLNSIPSKALRTREFRSSHKYRLGMPVYGTKGPCTACGFPSDCYGTHSRARHNMLRDMVLQAAQQSVLSPRREKPFLIAGGLERSAEVSIPSWYPGYDTALDITLTSLLQQCEGKKAAQETDSALENRYQSKMTNYFDRCRDQGVHFLPLPVETLGGWHP